MKYQLCQLSKPYEKYVISNDGRLFNLKLGELKEMNLFTSAKGYKLARLYDGNGKRRSCDLHRLVLLTFCGPPPDSTHVARHLNGNSLDNRIENLCWGSVQDNSNDMVAHGRSTKGEKHPNSKLTEELVLKIRKELEEGSSGVFLSKKYGVVKSVISMIKNRKIWNHI